MAESPSAPSASGAASRGSPASAARSGGSASQRDDLELTTAPNLLTMGRVIMVPLVVGLLFQGTRTSEILAAIAFGLAAITDYFDGYLARKQKSESVFGKLMDPLADKFLVVSTLCMLQQMGRIHVVIVILLICREMAITGLRALASSEGLIIAASRSAKWKTAVQMVGLPFLMVRDPVLGIPLFQIGVVLIDISLAISLWTAKDYIVDFFKALGKKRREKRMKKKELRALRKRTKSASKPT